MKRTAKKLFVAAAVAAVAVQSSTPANACGGRGGRVVRPSYGYPTTVYRQPAPVYHASPYQQPYASQPVRVVQPAPATTVAAVQPKPRGLVAAQAAAATQPAPAQPLGNQPARGQAISNQTPAVNAVSAQPVGTQTQPQPQATRPPSQATNNATAARPAASDAETSALAALASLTAATTAPSTPAPSPAGVPAAANANVSAAPADGTAGVYRATLPSKVVIELRLNQGGTFSWAVIKNGSKTEFSGQYRVDQGRLTLVRNNDLQKMAGRLTAVSNGFTFKLDGANNAGLNFTRV